MDPYFNLTGLTTLNRNTLITNQDLTLTYNDLNSGLVYTLSDVPTNVTEFQVPLFNDNIQLQKTTTQIQGRHTYNNQANISAQGPWYEILDNTKFMYFWEQSSDGVNWELITGENQNNYLIDQSKINYKIRVGIIYYDLYDNEMLRRNVYINSPPGYYLTFKYPLSVPSIQFSNSVYQIIGTFNNYDKQ